MTERARARQQQVDEQADDDRRQAHQRVEKRDHDTPARKARDRHGGTERQADAGGERRGGEAHGKREPHDFEQLGVEACDEARSQCDAVGDRLHRIQGQIVTSDCDY